MDFPVAKRVATNGVELEVFEAGAGRPIVLLHGWPELAYSWRHQIEPLVEAGYHVIAPNQRGYGRSSRPSEVAAYDVEQLAGDAVGLLDHYGYDDAVFVGHDWGAILLWNLAMIHPSRVSHVINMSVPFMERGTSEWVGFWETMLGGDFYIVHFNRQPGVADRVFEENCARFLGNLYRTRQWEDPPPALAPGMPLMALAELEEPTGIPLMSQDQLAVFVDAFQHSGFTGGINWYRNISRNWEIIGRYEQRITQPTLMIYGDYDLVPKSETLGNFVPDLTVQSFPCGHWIQQEKPKETTDAILGWLSERVS